MPYPHVTNEQNEHIRETEYLVSNYDLSELLGRLLEIIEALCCKITELEAEIDDLVAPPEEEDSA